MTAQLLKEAEAEVEEFFGGSPEAGTFVDGAKWLFTRLSEMSEWEFDADSARQESYRRDDEQTKTNGEEYLDAFSFIEGARHQHALSQAALLKAREERDIVSTANELNFKKYAAGIEKERARCERLEKRLREALHGEFDAYDTGFNGSADEYIEREVSQALSGDE